MSCNECHSVAKFEKDKVVCHWIHSDPRRWDTIPLYSFNQSESCTGSISDSVTDKTNTQSISRLRSEPTVSNYDFNCIKEWKSGRN
mmetsp:Transcript_6877/g.12311  ORF Transcript_6877/g.12311 Transcript_6877/m.12311 type:complete len:86 (-) Transcript_6877:1226-1483(-)